MSKKQVIILVVAGVIVVVGIIFGILGRQGGIFTPADKGEKQSGEGRAPLGDAEVPLFTTEVPKDAKPTAPQAEAPATPGATEKLGIFEMRVSSNGFEPNSITVNKGDVVQIRLTAQGGDYDFTVPYGGLYTEVKEGETKQITFGATSVGTFSFMCRDFCPAGKTITGSIIVLP